MSKIFDQIPALSVLSKEFSSSCSVTLIIFVTLFYQNTDINTLCSDELMVIRLSEAFWWGKDTDLGETTRRNLGNAFARNVIFCMLLLALFSYYTETSKTYTSSSPSISLNPDFKKHPLTLSVLLLTLLWLQTEGSSLQVQWYEKGFFYGSCLLFTFPWDTSSNLENLQEDAITFLPSTLL